MQLLISDANILIDMEEGLLLNELFQLSYQITVSDILFAEELEEQHAYLLDKGLRLCELTPASLNYVHDLIGRVTGPSRNDCFALALAKQEKCPLLTGDKALRKAAEQEAVQVMGTIWLVEQLVQQDIIDVSRASSAYDRMRNNGRRLPWTMVEGSLKVLKLS